MVHKTLNQIIKEVNNFATNHNDVHSFGVGRIWNFATSGDTKYPALWVDYSDVSIDNIYGGGSSTETTPVRVYISDRLQKGALNEQEVLSDIRETFFDLIAYISNEEYEWIIGQSVTLTRFGEEFHNDEISGYYCDINFTQSFLKDRCAIPYINGANEPSDSNGVVTILDQNGNVLTTVTCGRTYTVTVLTGIRDTIDSNTSTIIDPLT